MNRPAIAIDGPAVSGKSSVGREFAKRIGYKFLDTGLMYRAATWNALDAGTDVRDEAAVVEATERMQFSVSDSESGDNLIQVNGVDVTGQLHTINVDASVSVVSAVGRVREIMVEEQQRLASEGEIVVVGRDIGTVVMPDSPLKIYLTATAETRAARRHKDFVTDGVEVEYEEILKSMEERDKADSSRKNSPLKPAGDARVINTDEMTMDEVVQHLVSLAEDIL